MVERYLAALITIILILRPEAAANFTSSNLEVLRLVESYGMNILHGGKDYFELKKPLQWKSIELQNVRIYNLKSMYSGCTLVAKKLPPIVSMNSQWKTNTQCFSITWCVGFEKLQVEAQSKRLSLFKTKFHNVTINIRPLLLQTQLKICFPFMELVTQSEVNSNLPINSSCEVTFSVEVQDVHFKKWDGVRLEGDGTFNGVLALLLKSGMFDQLIRKEIQKKMRKIVSEKFANFRQKLCHRIDRLVKRTIERYAIKPH